MAQNCRGPVNRVPFPLDIRREYAVGPRLTPRLLNFDQHAYAFPCQPTYGFQQQPCPGIWPAAFPNFVTVCPQHQMVKSNANQGFVHVPNVVDTYVVPQMPLNVSGVPVLPTNASQPGPISLSKLPSAVAPAVPQHQHFVQRDGNQRYIYLSNAWNMVNPLLVPPWRMSPMPLVSVTHVPPMAVPLPVPVSFSLFIAATPQFQRIVLGKELSPFLERLKHANIGQLNRSFK